MPLQAPLRKMRSPSYQVEYVAVDFSVIIWDHGQNGPLWVHPNTVINIPPGFGHINTTIQTLDREVVPITVSQSGLLLGVDNGWFNSGVSVILCVSPAWVCDIYIPFYLSSRKQD